MAFAKLRPAIDARCVMNLLWVYIGFAVVALLLVLLLARVVGNS